MAEAFGIAVGTFQLVQLCGTIIQSCFEYVEKVKGASDGARRLITEVASLRSILERQQQLVSEANEERLALLKSLEDGPFQACYNNLDKIQKKLQSIVVNGACHGITRRLIWPFDEAKMDGILYTLEKHKTSILLAITTDNAAMTIQMEKEVSDIVLQMEAQRRFETKKGILGWLGVTVDPTRNHDEACAKREAGTGNWLLASKHFQEWLRGGHKLMWLNGIPGAGKTVLSSTVIEHVTAQCKSSRRDRVAYYYFDFRDEAKQTADGCIRSLTQQLFLQSEKVPALLEELYEEGRSIIPNIARITRILGDMLDEEPMDFIVIDALDECREDDNQHEREVLFRVLQTIFSSVTGPYAIFVASRRVADIERTMKNLGARNVDMQNCIIDEDIHNYVRACMKKEERFKKWPLDVKSTIQDRLAADANGMFRWAACQLDSLKQCLKPKNALRKLDTLPKTLDETYSRIIQNIPSDCEQEMRTILTFLAFSVRPVTIQEVAEATAIDLDEGCFSVENRFPEPFDILEFCSSLVSLSSGTPSALKKESLQQHWQPEVKSLQFSHFTVKEYILSERAQSQLPPSFIITPSLSHRNLAKICLMYLLDFNNGERVNIFEHDKYPLLVYAALHWKTHLASTQNDDLQDIEELLLRLLHFKNFNNLVNYLNLCDPFGDGKAIRRQQHGMYRSKEAIESPLYYACHFQFLPTIRTLLTGSGDRFHSAKDMGPALELAASRGYVEITRILREGGADPNTRHVKQFSTPLLAAISSGCRDTVALLLDFGADLHAGDAEWGTSLHAAARQGNSDTIQLLIDRGHAVNPWVQNYGTPLTIAARHNKHQVIETLLRAGSNPNIYGGEYHSPLLAACEFSHLCSVIAILEAGASMESDGWQGGPLHSAAKGGKVNTMKLLIDRGADVNHSGTVDTPLKLSIESMNQEAFQLLLDQGADVNNCGKLSDFPLDRALAYGNLFAAEKLLEVGGEFREHALGEILNHGEREGLVRVLLKRGANPNVRHPKWGNLLHLAIKQIWKDAILWLLEAGADANAVEGKYGTPLQRAVAEEKTSIVGVLLKQGAKVNYSICGEYGTPLHAAAFKNNRSLAMLLIDHGADVTARGGKYETVLQAQAASEKENEEMARLFIDKGAEINAIGGKYGSALRAAIVKGHDNIVQLLLDKDAVIESPDFGDTVYQQRCCYMDHTFRTTLEVAVARGNLNIVRQFLLSRGDIKGDGELCASVLTCAVISPNPAILDFFVSQGLNVKQYGGKAVITAIDWKKPDIVEKLIDLGADVNYHDETNPPPLQVAIRSKNMKIMQLLLGKGADINLQSGYAGTALQEAIDVGSREMMMELLKRKASIDAKGGKWKTTALILAIEKGDDEMVRELLDRGADINLCYGYWGTALLAAIGGEYYGLADELLDRGADPNPKDSDVRTTALIAASGLLRQGQLELIRRLARSGIDKEAVGEIFEKKQSERGKALLHLTALQYAAYSGNESAVSVLIKCGANVNTPAGTYGNALQAATQGGHLRIVCLLLEHGADVNAKGGKFGTALQSAVAQGKDSVAHALLQRGADVNVEGGYYGSPLQVASKLGNRHIVN
ncbi:hypothetical protein FRC16_010360, partial [Serendipita sp. 398]